MKQNKLSGTHSIKEILDTMKPNKYKNEKYGGYASLKEYRYATQLKLMQKQGLIKNMQEQVTYLLIPTQRDEKGKLLEKKVKYIADFVYEENGEIIVVDTKGYKTKEYILKRKMMLFLHHIKIKEV